VTVTPSGMEGVFDRFSELPAGPVGPNVFRVLGSSVGIDVVGPPLSRSHPALTAAPQTAQ